MTLNIIFFASIREQIDCAQLTLNIAEPLTNIRQVKEILSKKGEQWHKVFSSSTLMTAINQQMVDDNAPVKSDDTIAFFPPVTGG